MKPACPSRADARSRAAAPPLAGRPPRRSSTGAASAPRASHPGPDLVDQSVVGVAGSPGSVTRQADDFHVDSARVVRVNIRAGNGVIHAIDTVLATP